ncbi:cytochrome c biogenesis protein CcsA [Bacteriovorax sp. PP10]|uniref:Cytochrome c biogenesis protein CcsA n=1 Tax=Bacteriovorax antarcticus TaxID=3088717 RepID=A0ABU5VVX3_9BACT|nr:cytochrome c biogenesis protein CcsA [Bacteriovorax sp. PP10]MEA9356504.1 cytochrome c biogenesis protein CcsA [Bacteriovorax sp. PP10]
MKTLLFLALLTVSNASQSAETYFCKPELETLPTQQGGRVKPLYVHASEAMKALTGKAKVGDLSAVEAYCLLSLNGMGLPSDIKLMAKIEHVDAIKHLNLPEGEHLVAYDTLVAMEDDVRNEARRTDVSDSYKKSMEKLFNNIFLYKEIKSGNNWYLADVQGTVLNWLPLTAYLTEDKVVAQKELTPMDPFLPVMLRTKVMYDQAFGTRYMVEYYYAKAGLASVAMLLSILALACLVLFKNFKIALGFASLSILTQITLITLRVIVSGRAPITNMYETVLFSGAGALLLGLILGHFKNEKLFVYMGLAYNVCTLMMINFANGMLTATISPLVPVLRDNFWLSTHVTTIILSYGALALSWILANTVLIKRRLGKMDRKEEAYHADVIYTTLKWGTTMLAAGIILGGVWADYSWGRFWGWDPKETWSLIVLCFYTAILHGRYTSWIKNDRFMTVTAAAFLSVMMAWFGVNYILASGLHSYGFSEGGAVFLGSFFLVQIIILIITKNYSKGNKEAEPV